MDIYTVSTVLASVAIFPLVLKVFYPYFWDDFFYLINLIWIFIKFGKRRGRKPLFLVLDRYFEQVSKHPNRPFLVFEDQTFSYQDADKKSNKIANAIQKHTDLKAGDTVALYMGNEPTFIFTWLALAKLGCPVALLNYNIRSKSLLHCFGCCEAKLLIAAAVQQETSSATGLEKQQQLAGRPLEDTRAKLQGAVEDVLPSLQEKGVSVLIMAKACSIPGMESLVDKAEEAEDGPISPSQRESLTFKSPAVYIYTSGTTGLPKAAVITQDRLLAAMTVLASNGVTPGDIIYLNLPLYHAAGFVIGFVGSIETGSKIILRRKFSASQFWEDCRKHHVTVIQYIGEVLRYLCNTPKASLFYICLLVIWSSGMRKNSDWDHKVRLAIGNGVRADVWREFLDRFGNIQVREFYAATEGNVGFLNYTGKIGAVGRVNYFHRKLFPYALIKYDAEKEEPVRDHRGLCVEAAKGETGLLVSRITKIAPFIGYARNDQQTEKKRLRDVFQKGDLYFNSGDLLRIDHENFIYFQDRVGDTFRWKGENVATTEVADVLGMAECIQEANVYGVKVSELKDAVKEVLPTLREQNVSIFILTGECGTDGMESLIDKIDQASDEPLSSALRSHVTMTSPALYIYTSGTTGLPKAAVVSQQRLWAASFMQAIAGVTAEDVVYICLPLYHTSGFVIGFTGAIERGATVVLKNKFSASQFWDDCRKHSVTVIQYIGETMRYLCNTPKRNNDQDHRVRVAIGNGARADVWRQFLNRFGDIRVTELYGSTEGNISFINYAGKIGAVGCVTFLHRKVFQCALLKYNTATDEPMRDHRGFCVEAAKGETGLLVSRITKTAPFSGYMGNLQQTEKKKLRDVFQKGDVYFNTGDLLRMDQDNFIYFQDRVGDTFRWKGENVATTEVADILTMADCIQEANVYGVKVAGHEGRIGMAAVTLKEGVEFDPISTCSQVMNSLPAYARPRFLRIQDSLETTGTFKQMKMTLVEEGFSPAVVSDPLYFLDEKTKTYIPMTQEIYNSIETKDIKL
ncbi:hypothetical protein JZ751_019458 [Albula glossodonta]|uniref:long-chain-fatty-acid--CoA ligase n=1 Tax=Albula glossodonta TaxID=121402 RepID=A0A8T2NUS8_9TELE|nr:hypothetical protein JZ751_019458 [Albula glossodonta]